MVLPLFLLIKPNISLQGIKPRAKQELSVIKGSATVERFLIDGHKFSQLSDHYGVKVTLQYTESTSDSDKEDAETAASTPYLHVVDRLESL